MSVDRKLWNVTLSALMFAGTACGTAAGRQGPHGERTPVVTPTKTAESNTIFEQANCTKAEITVPKPMGWTVLEIQISPTFINCYVSKQPINREEDFRSGLRISKIGSLLIQQDRVTHARQLASQPDVDVLPQANTFKEIRVGSFRIFSGRFTSSRNNLLQDEERKIIVPDGSIFVYIVSFTAPKPNSDEDFRKYGRNMLDGILIGGQPTK